MADVTPRRVAVLLWKHPSLRAMAWLRLATFLRAQGVRGVPFLLQQRLLTTYGLELNPGDDIDGGLYIAHPAGVVLKAARVGRNVTVVSAVTVGLRNLGRAPRIGDGVYIGTGARVIGDIELGAGCKIGANAVVMDSVPAGATAVGIPARVLPIKQASPAG